mmetsp:Transcript_66276/g.205064  ORF Transcript_66276/g.205064 Transcript_66276/m.205064 type:complete len:241 (+) Transcript_66276:1156-1878(+)
MTCFPPSGDSRGQHGGDVVVVVLLVVVVLETVVLVSVMVELVMVDVVVVVVPVFVVVMVVVAVEVVRVSVVVVVVVSVPAPHMGKSDQSCVRPSYVPGSRCNEEEAITARPTSAPASRKNSQRLLSCWCGPPPDQHPPRRTLQLLTAVTSRNKLCPESSGWPAALGMYTSLGLPAPDCGCSSVLCSFSRSSWPGPVSSSKPRSSMGGKGSGSGANAPKRKAATPCRHVRPPAPGRETKNT